MKKYIILAIFIFFILLPVNADTDYSHYWNVSLSEIDFLSSQNIDNSGHTYLEFLENLRQELNTSLFYDGIVEFSSNVNGLLTVNVFLTHKSRDYYEGYTTGSGGSSPPNEFSMYRLKLYSNESYHYKTFSHSSGDIYSTSSYTSLLTCLHTNTSCGNDSRDTFYFNIVYTANSFVSDQDININMNFNYPVNSSYYINKYIYYSSIPLTLIEATTGSFKRTLRFNNVVYNVGSSIPSYYDFFVKQNYNDSFLSYRNSIDTIYTNLSSSDISNYSLTYNFNLYTDLLSQGIITQNYVENLSFNYVCSTRDYYKDLNDSSSSYMYMYKNVPCSLSSSYIINNSTITYTFDNLVIDSNLLGDKTYITINSVYEDSSISYSIHNVGYNYSLGDFYNTTFKGNIYESFTNLPVNFNLFLSGYGDTSISNVNVHKTLSEYNIRYNSYSISNKMMKSSLIVNNNLLYNFEQDFYRFTTSLSNDTGLLIYQSGSNNTSLPQLDLFFNQNIGISFSSNQDTYYYYIDDNIPSYNDFIPPIPNTNDVEANFDDSNINSYLYRVKTFISGLNDDCLEVSSLTQSFYDGMPVIMQSFIFIIFILFCTYFLYVLIRK